MLNATALFMVLVVLMESGSERSDESNRVARSAAQVP
jgi:hypothetical protein